MVQIEAEDPSMVNTTDPPEVDVAVGVYGSPPFVASEGAGDVNVIVCEALATLKVNTTLLAAR
jgi:hypothetical protein